MRTRNVAVGAVALLTVGLGAAQPFRVGRVLSTEFLTSLARPNLASSDVAIINAEVGSAIIVNRHAPRDPIVYISGKDSFLWAQFAEQMPAAARGEPIHVTIRRWSVTSASCPNLVGKVDNFIATLEELLANPDGPGAVKSELIVDATTFRIEIAAKDAWMIITPSGTLDPPLQQAAGELHSIVSGCAGSREPEIEQHDF
jgi:hypothetical protein